MRVIAGSNKGRKLHTAAGLETRPTSDMLKGMLFNILAWRCQDAHVLDLCAGSGALGIEALSRGAAHATFVEQQRQSLDALKANLAACQVQDRGVVYANDVLRFLPGFKPNEAIDLVFFDPPYSGTLHLPVLHILGGVQWLAPEAIVIVEHHKKEDLPEEVLLLRRYRQSGHGSSVLSFYRPSDEDA